MDQSALVADGLMILKLLAEQKVGVKASALTYTDDRGWRFMLAPEQYDGEREFYTKLAKIIQPFDPRLSQIVLSDIEVIEPTSAFVEDLPRLMTGRVRSYDDIRVGRTFYDHVIALPNQPPIAGDHHPLRS